MLSKAIEFPLSETGTCFQILEIAEKYLTAKKTDNPDGFVLSN